MQTSVDNVFNAWMSENQRGKLTISVMSSLESLYNTRSCWDVCKGVGGGYAYRFATLPATCCDDPATLDFGDARGGAREDVSCSIAIVRECM